MAKVKWVFTVLAGWEIVTATAWLHNDNGEERRRVDSRFRENDRPGEGHIMAKVKWVFWVFAGWEIVTATVWLHNDEGG